MYFNGHVLRRPYFSPEVEFEQYDDCAELELFVQRKFQRTLDLAFRRSEMKFCKPLA
jgi:hypothetical protein